MVPMPPLAMAPNRMPKLIYVFRVDITQGEFNSRGAHDHEIERVELLPLEDAARMMVVGKIYVSVPVAVIGTYLLSRQIDA